MTDLAKPNFDARIPGFPLRLPSNMNIVNGTLDFRIQYSINQERVNAIQTERNRLANLKPGMLSFQIMEGSNRADAAKNVCEYVNMFSDIVELVQLVGKDYATTIYFKRLDTSMTALQTSLSQTSLSSSNIQNSIPEKVEQQQT